jgi:GDP-L-fucose synthase
MWTNKKILVTGGHGFLGSHIIKELKKRDAENIYAPHSTELDLRIQSNCKKAVTDIDVVFHAAGKGGGIGIMQKNPADIFYDNIMMGAQLLHEAKEANIEKFISVGTVCSYPKFANMPFYEDEIWNGYPEETNAAYGLSKKMLIVQAEAYKKQFNFNSIVIVPTNMYGPFDDFNPNTSHVIPAIIYKITQAQRTGSQTIVMWGDGTPTRDFLYVEDAARGIVMAAEKYDDPSPINISSEEEVSIKELTHKISTIMKYDGKIIWDTSKPNGQPRRCVSNKKAREKFGFIPEIKLDDGLQHTIKWFNQFSPQNNN